MSAQIIIPADSRAAVRPERWERVDLQPVSATTQIVAAAHIISVDAPPYWVISGATAAAPPERKPAAWISKDLQSFAPIPMQPNQGYGEIAEVFGIAGRGPSGHDLAGIAQAFGGAHGNPRTASWDGSADGLHEVRTNFELYNGVRQISVKSIAANLNTYVIMGSRVSQNGRLGAASWTSPDGADFTLFDNDAALSSAPNEQLLAADITVDPSGNFVAAGERLWWDPTNSADTINTDAILWRSADGQTWSRWTPPGYKLTGKGEQRIQKVAFDNGKLVTAGTETVNGKVWVTVWGPNGKQRISPFGSSDDPLSTVTTLSVTDDRWIVGARVSGRLRMAISKRASKAKQSRNGWSETMLPSGLPTGGRARFVVVSETGGAVGGALLVGASGLDAGGLWRQISVSDGG
jgi:hypothetical protein